jgi:hypothetical protein
VKTESSTAGTAKSGTAFTLHIKEKTLPAVRAMAHIQSLSKLFLETAMKLFDLKIASSLTYGLTVTLEHLGENSLKVLGSVKPTNLMKTQRV